LKEYEDKATKMEEAKKDSFAISSYLEQKKKVFEVMKVLTQ